MQYPYIHIYMIAKSCLALVSENVNRNLIYREHVFLRRSSLTI